MSGFDYGNARLKAMKSRLLTRRKMEALVEAKSLQGLIAALTKTAYQKSVESSLARESGMNCISEALHKDLVHTFAKVRNFYIDPERKLVTIFLRKYDVHNVKAVFRGLTKHASYNEIFIATLPVGELTEAMLVELCRVPGLRPAMDLLITMGHSLAQPLLNLRTEHPGAGLPHIELALDQWYYQDAYRCIQSSRLDSEVVLSALQLDIDIANLLTVIRFVHAPSERKFLREWLDSDDLCRLFLSPGRLSFDLLISAEGQETLDGTVESLTGTPYEPSLRAGLKAYKNSLRLSDFEKHLKRFRLRWMSRLISTDPLGIGVLLGFLALKINEINNIRWIAQGISMQRKVETIRTELEYPI
jgi:V/A-type H+-transporting ATPase subunit C